MGLCADAVTVARAGAHAEAERDPLAHGNARADADADADEIAFVRISQTQENIQQKTGIIRLIVPAFFKNHEKTRILEL